MELIQSKYCYANPCMSTLIFLLHHLYILPVVVGSTPLARPGERLMGSQVTNGFCNFTLQFGAECCGPPTYIHRHTDHKNERPRAWRSSCRGMQIGKKPSNEQGLLN